MFFKKLFRKDISNTEATLDRLISDNPIVVFTKPDCPYCIKSKDLLRSLSQKVAVVEVEERQDGKEMIKLLVKRTGLKTLPSIFVDGRHIAGYLVLKEMVPIIILLIE